MMHTDSEHDAKLMLDAMQTNTYQDKATKKETRYEKWKRSKKAKNNTWKQWYCCWFFAKKAQDNEQLLGAT